MGKAYELHENVYRNLRRAGTRSWNEGTGNYGSEIEPEVTDFLTWVMDQAWAPKSGNALELGCGTGPMLRWLCGRGFTGIGLDVSATAIAMAREQSRGLPLRFRRTDLCRPLTGGLGTFDLAVDAHCLHCLVNKEDRQGFLTNAFRLLKPGGVFVVQSMCAPIDRIQCKEAFPGQRVIGGTLHIPAPEGCNCEGLRRIGAKDWIPTRRIEHWRGILAEVAAAGFELRHFRVTTPCAGEPAGNLNAVAQRPVRL